MAKMRKQSAQSTVTLPISMSDRVSVWNTSSMETERVSTLRAGRAMRSAWVLPH